MDNQLLLTASLIAAGGFILLSRYRRATTDPRLKPEDLDAIPKKALIKSLFELSAQTFKQLGKTVSAAKQLEIYGLFKQINEGNADEFDEHKKRTLPNKYKAWLKNKDKSEHECMCEYISLVANQDKKFRELCRQVISGKLTSVHVDQ